jgi:hypothetical protein
MSWLERPAPAMKRADAAQMDGIINDGLMTCHECGQRFPLAARNWSRQSGGQFRRPCRTCRNNLSRVSQSKALRNAPASEICDLCYGLPWRRERPRCGKCKAERLDEQFTSSAVLYTESRYGDEQ